MDALTAIQQRVSSSILCEPGPTSEQLEQILKAAMRAPDHGCLTPWRFLSIAGDARQKFAEVLHAVLLAEDAPQHKLLKAQKTPLRAPLILIVIAQLEEGRIPIAEQEHSAAAAAQNALVAAEAQGLGAIWRTGWPTEHAAVREALSIADNEKIIAFIYIGQRETERRPIRHLAIEDYWQAWG